MITRVANLVILCCVAIACVLFVIWLARVVGV